MIEIIQQKLDSYKASNPVEEEQATKEIMQEIALYGLWRAGFFKVAAFQGGTLPEIRKPHAVRPWQFVMDPLHGYLTLAENLWTDGRAFAGAWNFGPDEAGAKTVGYVANQLSRGWGEGAEWQHDESDQPHEATYLKLDSSKAHSALSWSPVLDLATTLPIARGQGFARQSSRSTTLGCRSLSNGSPRGAICRLRSSRPAPTGSHWLPFCTRCHSLCAAV